MAKAKTKSKKAPAKRAVKPRVRRAPKKRIAAKPRNKRTVKKTRAVAQMAMAKRTWVHRVEAVLLSLILLLCGVTANAAVVFAAGKDIQRAENEAAFMRSEYKQPKEYLYDRAMELDLDYRILERIAFCESNWRMVKSSQSSAYGFFQIIDGTERYTPSFKAGQRKYDARTNIDMGVYLYSRYGVFPWTESKPCWKSALSQG